MRQRRRGRKQKIETALSNLIEQMVDDHSGSCAAFARLAGLTPGQLSTYMNPGRLDPPPGVLVCMKLSRASGVEPWIVLRLAGHDKIADAVEEITVNHSVRLLGGGRAAKGLVSGIEMEMVKDFRTLSPQVRESIIFLIRRAAEERDPAKSAGELIAQKDG